MGDKSSCLSLLFRRCLLGPRGLCLFSTVLAPLPSLTPAPRRGSSRWALAWDPGPSRSFCGQS